MDSDIERDVEEALRWDPNDIKVCLPVVHNPQEGAALLASLINVSRAASHIPMPRRSGGERPPQ